VMARQMNICPACAGKGWVEKIVDEYESDHGPGTYSPAARVITLPCFLCGGTGQRIKKEKECQNS
jgi:DnaJ-class molecular chaperone